MSTEPRGYDSRDGVRSELRRVRRRHGPRPMLLGRRRKVDAQTCGWKSGYPASLGESMGTGIGQSIPNAGSFQRTPRCRSG
jgi:hypothetical protein